MRTSLHEALYQKCSACGEVEIESSLCRGKLSEEAGKERNFRSGTRNKFRIPQQHLKFGMENYRIPRIAAVESAKAPALCQSIGELLPRLVYISETWP